jgi:hypothetical protein
MGVSIKNFKKFLESISGTELVGPVGPAYGETRIQNKNIYMHHTNVIYSDLDDKFYTIDEYNDLYNEYLKKGGNPIIGFSKENIEKILIYLKE